MPVTDENDDAPLSSALIVSDSTCNAPDCDDEIGSFPSFRYCSNVCMNVSMEAAAIALERGVMASELPDDVLADIRERREESQAKFQKTIKENSNSTAIARTLAKMDRNLFHPKIYEDLKDE